MIKVRVKSYIEGTFNKEDVIKGDQEAMWESLFDGVEYFLKHSQAPNKELRIEYIVMPVEMLPHMRITTTGSVFRQSFEQMVLSQLDIKREIIYLRNLIPPYTYLLIPPGDHVGL